MTAPGGRLDWKETGRNKTRERRDWGRPFQRKIRVGKHQPVGTSDLGKTRLGKCKIVERPDWVKTILGKTKLCKDKTATAH